MREESCWTALRTECRKDLPAWWLLRWGGVIVLILLGVTLRIHLLTAKPFWFDETFSVFIASHPSLRILSLVSANDPHPPLYYLILRLWMGLVGRGEFGIRLLSVLAGISTLGAVAALGYRLFGWKAVLPSILVLSISLSQVASSQEARMYPLLGLFATASWLALSASVMSDRLTRWIAYSLSLILLILTHYYGFFVWGSQGLYLLWAKSRRDIWRYWTHSSLLALVIFLPWLPSFMEQWQSGRGWPEYRPSFSLLDPLRTLAMLTAGGRIGTSAGLGGWTMASDTFRVLEVAGLGAAFVLAALLFTLTSGPPSKAPVSPSKLLLTATFGPLLLASVCSLRLNIFSPRYLSFIGPPLALVLGAGAAAGLNQTQIGVKLSAMFAMVVLVVSNIGGLRAYYNQPRLDDFDWRRAALVVRERVGAEDALVFLPSFSRIPFSYYLPGPQPRLALVPDGQDVVDEGGLRMAGVVGRLSRHARVWIITADPLPIAVWNLERAMVKKGYVVQLRARVNRLGFTLLVRGIHGLGRGARAAGYMAAARSLGGVSPQGELEVNARTDFLDLVTWMRLPRLEAVDAGSRLTSQGPRSTGTVGWKREDTLQIS